MIEINEEEYDLLPFKESMFDRFINRKDKGQWRRHWKSEYHPIEDSSPYKICDRVQQKFIGKSFDNAFSYFCKLVPKYQQKLFLEQFDKYYYWSYWYINDNGNIQYYRKKNDKLVCITSPDYQVEKRHKITGHKKNHFKEVYSEKTVTRKEYFLTKIYGRPQYHPYTVKDKFLYYEYCGKNPSYREIPWYLKYRAQISDFENVIVKGFIKYFSSKNDYRYKRHWAEDRKARKKKAKEERKLKSLTNFSLLLKDHKLSMIEFKRKQQEKIKREEQFNIQTIERLGFDPITSFRNH